MNIWATAIAAILFVSGLIATRTGREILAAKLFFVFLVVSCFAVGD